MTATVPPPQAPEIVEVDLRDPLIAAILAWLWPGAGHIYQRRYGKGVLFMVCILGAFFFGLALADGKAVYAAGPSDGPEGRGIRGLLTRAHYFCQLGVGIPALPALVQKYRVANNKEPLFGGIMAPPAYYHPNADDEVAQWQKRYHKYWELATLYTMVAGLLNVLVIYDAYAGPMLPAPEEKKRDESPSDEQSK